MVSYAPIRKHEPWRAELPAKQIMSITELEKSLNYSNFQKYMEETQRCWSPEKSNNETETIRKDVEGLAERLVDFLRSRYKMFSGSKLLKTGSSYEGVKLGPPDEFDFMIEVPALQDEKIIEIKIPEFEDFPYKARITDPKFFDDIHPTMLEENPGKYASRFWVQLRKIIWEFLKKYFRGNDHWQVQEEHVVQQVPRTKKGFTFKRGFREDVEVVIPEHIRDLSWTSKMHAATTFVLIWRGDKYPNLDVSLDFCVAVPMLSDPQTENLDVYYYKEVEDNRCIPCHILLLTTFYCRLSFSVQEMQIMRKYPFPMGQNICMRLLKYLRDSELPQKRNPETNELLVKMPSYMIKTVLYGLYKKYDITSAWDKGTACNPSGGIS